MFLKEYQRKSFLRNVYDIICCAQKSEVDIESYEGKSVGGNNANISAGKTDFKACLFGNISAFFGEKSS